MADETSNLRPHIKAQQETLTSVQLRQIERLQALDAWEKLLALARLPDYREIKHAGLARVQHEIGGEIAQTNLALYLWTAVKNSDPSALPQPQVVTFATLRPASRVGSILLSPGFTPEMFSGVLREVEQVSELKASALPDLDGDLARVVDPDSFQPIPPIVDWQGGPHTLVH